MAFPLLPIGFDDDVDVLLVAKHDMLLIGD